MKKTILLAAIAFTAITANAQKMKEADVPASVKAAFVKQYPAVKGAKWEMEDGKYEAGFDLNKVETSVLIESNGTIVETESEIAVSALPKAVADYCAKNCAGKKIKEASKITDAKGKVTFEAEVNEADYLFDSNGMFIKKSVEAPDAKDEKK
jgi:uncharacterized lipoprotein NlpE involved in copper resistance